MGWTEAAHKLNGYSNGHVELRAEAYPLRLDNGTFAEWMGISNYAGKTVSEDTVTGLTAVYRSVAIISGSIAGLPLKAFRNMPDGMRERVTDSWIDNPGGAFGMTPFEFKEIMLVHSLLHGNFYGLNLYNGAGALIGLQPIHPLAVEVKPVETEQEKEKFPGFFKYFEVKLKSGSHVEFSPAELTHIPGMSTDGLKGLSPISVFKQALSAGMAADEAAARVFSNGFLLGGMVSTKEDVNEDEAKIIKDDLNKRGAGSKNAGDILFVNRLLEFSPFAMSAEDAQFIESRAFQIEEVSRIYGVPPHLLSQTEKQTSWGTGVAEQNLGLQRYTLMSHTSRIEERLTKILPNKQFCEFDYSGFLQSSPKEELEMLVLQVNNGLLTVNEARAIRNLPPLEGTTSEEEE